MYIYSPVHSDICPAFSHAVIPRVHGQARPDLVCMSRCKHCNTGGSCAILLCSFDRTITLEGPAIGTALYPIQGLWSSTAKIPSWDRLPSDSLYSSRWLTAFSYFDNYSVSTSSHVPKNDSWLMFPTLHGILRDTRSRLEFPWRSRIAAFHYLRGTLC
jgi:hypothetical protein